MQLMEANLGIGITGIAGPTGGSKEKPVGLVYIAVAGKYGTKVTENYFSGERDQIRYRATQQALSMLRHYIMEHDKL